MYFTIYVCNVNSCYNSEYLPVESDGKVSDFPPSPMYITASIPKNKASTTTKITDTMFWLLRVSSLFVVEGLNVLLIVSRGLSRGDVVCLELAFEEEYNDRKEEKWPFESFSFKSGTFDDKHEDGLFRLDNDVDGKFIDDRELSLLVNSDRNGVS